MYLIREETVQDTVILTASGEVLVNLNESSSLWLEEACKQAYEKGEESGEQQGFEHAGTNLKISMELLNKIIAKVLEYRSHLLERLKPEVIEFALKVCERIIRRELSHPEAFVRLLNTLLSTAATSFKHQIVEIHLHPDDLSLLEDHLTQIQYHKRELKGIEFISDIGVKRGSCSLETETGLLNYDIPRELEELQTRILNPY